MWVFVVSLAFGQESWVPSPAFVDAARALSARDGAFDCAAVEALATDSVALLRELVDHAQNPPWVAMRAADCLVTGHAVEAAADLDAWVVDPERRGLGILVLGRLDVLPEPMAISLAQRAMTAGPNPTSAKRRIERATSAAVRAVVAP